MLLLVPMLLSACRAHYPVAQESGKEDMAYLLFVGTKEYGGQEVEVSIDNAAPFKAKVVKSRVSNRKGTQYGIATGARSIKVSANGKVLYEKQIFVSTQEVKQIVLP